MLSNYSSDACCEKNVIKLLGELTINFKKLKSAPCVFLQLYKRHGVFFAGKNSLGIIKDFLQNPPPQRV